MYVDVRTNLIFFLITLHQTQHKNNKTKQVSQRKETSKNKQTNMTLQDQTSPKQVDRDSSTS